MDYHKKLKNALTIQDVQHIYDEAFRQAIAEIEESFASEGKGQKLVFSDGSIAPSLTITDTFLLIHAESRARQLIKTDEKELLINSNHDSFVDKKMKESK